MIFLKPLDSQLQILLQRFSLPLANLRGQTYDGASNMSGIHRGAQTILLKKQPLVYYTHCSCHCVNLVAKDVAELPLVRDAVSILNELKVLFSNTIKFRNILSQNCASAKYIF